MGKRERVCLCFYFFTRLSFLGGGKGRKEDSYFELVPCQASSLPGQSKHSTVCADCITAISGNTRQSLGQSRGSGFLLSAWWGFTFHPNSFKNCQLLEAHLLWTASVHTITESFLSREIPTSSLQSGASADSLTHRVRLEQILKNINKNETKR